jgi:glycerol-3-phosphate dehydrogenase (NAD(P)+)
MSKTIAVLGLGNFGTALANHLARKGYEVLGWCKRPEMADSINRLNTNPDYLNSVQLSANLKATTDFSATLSADIVLLSFPSSALSEIVPRLKLRPDSIMVSAIKGLDRETLLTPLQYFRMHHPECGRIAALSGPSFARDIARQRPSGVVSASDDEAVAREVADLFSNEHMRVYSSGDTIGVEIGGVVKNVIALAAGVIDGMDLGDSARAGLITRGLAEMMRLAQAMGAQAMTLSGLSGLGDLIMTSTSELSRNRTVGLRLGRGEHLDHIVKTLGSVAEGVKTTALVVELAERYKVEMPITHHVRDLLEGRHSATEMVRSLLARPLKREF